MQKGIEKPEMKHPVVKAILKLCGKSILLTAAVGIVVVVIGTRSNWNTALEYSNAFFVAGFFVIAGGLASRLGANQDVNQLRLSSSADSFRKMDMSDRLDLLANSRGSTNLAAVCSLSGILLMLLSVLISKIF
jgi:hypothetical protein